MRERYLGLGQWAAIAIISLWPTFRGSLILVNFSLIIRIKVLIFGPKCVWGRAVEAIHGCWRLPYTVDLDLNLGRIKQKIIRMYAKCVDSHHPAHAQGLISFEPLLNIDIFCSVQWQRSPYTRSLIWAFAVRTCLFMVHWLCPISHYLNSLVLMKFYYY